MKLPEILCYAVLVACAAFALFTLATEECEATTTQYTNVRVLAFTSQYCGPCKRVYPMLVRIRAAGVEVRIIDVDRQPGLTRQYGVTSVPTFIVQVYGRSFRTHNIAIVLQLCNLRF